MVRARRLGFGGWGCGARAAGGVRPSGTAVPSASGHLSWHAGVVCPRQGRRVFRPGVSLPARYLPWVGVLAALPGDACVCDCLRGNGAIPLRPPCMFARSGYSCNSPIRKKKRGHSEVPPFRRRQLLAAFHAGHTQCLAWGEPCASVAQLPRKALVLLRGWLHTKGVEAAGGYSASADEFSDASAPRCGVARTPSPPRGRRRSRSPRPRHALRSAGERAASAARPGSWLSIQQAAGGEPSPARGRPQAPLLP